MPSVLSNIKKIIARIPPDAWALFLYAISFGILTFPLVLHFTHGFAGAYNVDAPIYVWNVWEWKRKLLSGDFSFFTNDIFYPRGASFIMHTHTMVQSLFVLAVDSVFRNLALSFNTVYFFSTLAAAYFTYKFTQLRTNHFWGSVIAGHYFAYQQLWGIYALVGTYNLIALWYLPGALYLYELYRHNKDNRLLVVCGLVVGLSFLNEFIIFAFTAAALALYMFFAELFAEHRHSLKKYLYILVLLAVGFISITGWKWYIMHQERAEIAAIAIPTAMDVDVYHADVVNLVRPTRFHMLWGNLNKLFIPDKLASGNSFIGFTVIALLVAYVVVMARGTRHRVNRSALYTFFIPFVALIILSWGPFWHVWGHNTGLPLPYYWLGKLYSQFNNVRVPLRWLFVSTFFLAQVVSLVYISISDSLPKKYAWLLAGLVYSGLVLDVLFVPKNILYLNTNVSPVWQQIATDTSGSAVLELPLAISSGYYDVGSGTRSSLLHQVLHQHPIIGGHLSRLPFSVRDFYENEPVLSYFASYTARLPAATDTASSSIKHFADTYHVGYVVLDKYFAPVDATSTQAMLKYVTSTLKFKEWYNDDQFTVYTQ